ncbi:MAG: chromosome segregation protein, partial [Chlamydiales bacterium]
MLSNTTVLLTLLLGGTVAGFMLGLWFQSLRHKTARRVQQELWDRKFHLAEADRQEAIEAINANNVEMKKVRGTFDSYKVEIQRLESELESDRHRSVMVEKDLIQRKQMVAALQSEVESLKASIEKATTESARKTTVFRELAEEHEAVSEELVASRQQANQLDERATEAEGRVVSQDQNIDQLERRFAALSEDKEVVEEELRGRIEELDPLPEQVEAALAEIARWRTQHEELELEKERLLESRESATLEALGEKAELISALEQRVQELEPLQGKLSDTDAELQAARQENDELGKVSDERNAALRETTALLEHARESIA